jgi:maleate isomerase
VPVVAIISPAGRIRADVQLRRVLPDEIAVVEDSLHIKAGTEEELEAAIPRYEDAIARLAEQKPDLIHPAGAPPLLLGYEGERAVVARWETRYGTPIFTNGMSQVNALRALGARKIVALSYFPDALNLRFARYYEEAGFEITSVAGIGVPFREVPQLAPEAVREFIEGELRRNPGADALYLLGPAWPTLDLVDDLEREFAIPVVHHVPAQSWEMQRRLGLRRPYAGFGRLISEMPALPL